MAMEVQFNPEQAALRVLEVDAEIRAGIQRGIEQADRGELIDHDEVVERFEPRVG